jgi:hypothetical protein
VGTPVPQTAESIITGALRFCNVYAPGESLAADDAADALEMLNDLLESLSTDQASVYASSEEVFSYVGGQYRYTIGNYDAGTFAGVVTNGSPTITGVIVPTDMLARGDLSGSGIPAGTTILSFNSGAGTVTMSANATATPGAQQIAYTIPGDFKTERPLRITQAFTRITTSGLGARLPDRHHRSGHLHAHRLQGDLGALANRALVQPDRSARGIVLLPKPLGRR